MKKLITILFTLCAGYSFSQTTHYIDPTGDDIFGSGTIGSPWKTLYKACNTVTTAGDSIHVKAGTYNETLQCLLSPGVNLGGVDSSLSIITSTLTSDFTPILYLGSAEGTNGNQRISKLKFIGNYTCQMAIVVSGRSNVHIYSSRFYTFNDRGVVFRGKADWSDGAPTTYSTGNKFYNNYIYDCARSDASYGRGNLEVGGQRDIEIYNDTIIQPVRAGNLSGYCIKNVNQGFLKGMKIHHSYLKVPPYPYAIPFTNNHWSFATEFSDISGMEYHHNRVYGSADQNHIYPDSANGYNFGAWYHHNEFGFDALQRHPVEGIIMEYHCKEVTIDSNTFKNTAIPLYFTPRPGSQIRNLIFSNNYCPGVGIDSSGNYTQGIKINTSQPPLIASGWKIFNNTIIANTTVPPDYGIDIPPGDSMSLKNNSVTGFGNDIHIFGASENRFFVSQNNNYATSQIVGTLPATAVVNGNINVSPNLDANGIPNAGSGLIDAGVYTGTPYYGVKRDIGAGEYPTAGNATPSAVVPYSRRLIQPLDGLAVTGYGYDPDGTISTKTWSQTSGPASVTFTSASSFSTSILGMTAIGAYVIRLTVTDNSGATSYSEFTITVVTAGSNANPTVTASADQTITLPSSSVSISQSATDSDGSIVSYAWSKLSGSGTITNSSTATTTVTGLDKGITRLEARATDNDDGIGRDTLTITVNPPTVATVTSVAGPDQSISSSSATLMGYGIPPTTGGYNLLLYSEQVDNAAAWAGNAGSINVTANQANDLEGNNTMEMITTTAANDGYWGETRTVNPSSTYTLSFDVKRGTATDVNWGIRDQSNFNDLVPPTSYYSLTSASGVTRVQLSFTTTASTTSITVHPVYKGATGTVYIGRVQLAPSSSDMYHVTTTTAYTAGNTTGTITGTVWRKLTGPSCTITTPSSDTTTVTGLSSGTYTFELEVTDNAAATARDTIQLTVSGADVTPPTVNSHTPTASATNVTLSSNVVINFSEDLAGASVTSSSVYITGITGSVSESGGVVTINPTSDLAYSTTYTVNVTTAVTDVAGNALASNYTYTFTTEAAPGIAPSGKVYRRFKGIKIKH